jgi:hypothetical protein
LSGVYELSLRRASEAGSPGRTLIVAELAALELEEEIFATGSALRLV